MLALGLPGLAAQILDQAETGERAAALRAKILMAQGRYSEVPGLAEIGGSADLSELTAESLLRDGKAERAWKEFGAGLSGSLGERVAWNAAQWDHAQSSAAKSRVTALMTAETAPLEDIAEPLSAARNLLNNSQDVRAAIDELLSETAPVTN